MEHKRMGMPSKGWICAYLRRYENQRAAIRLEPGSSWWKLCTAEGAFDENQPIFMSGVFCGVMKRPRDWSSWSASGPMKLYLRFRKVFFGQGDRWATHPLGRTHYMNRRQEAEFELSEIQGVKWADALQAMVPRLGYSPGRIDCSEGSSAQGFPSTKEPSPPPRGSDFMNTIRRVTDKR
jgi:hypothetical protein